MKDSQWTQDPKNLLWIIGALVFLIWVFCGGSITELPPPGRARVEGKKQMTKPKRSAEQQVADELERRALHPLSSRQTISDSQAEPEFHANHKRLSSLLKNPLAIEGA